MSEPNLIKNRVFAKYGHECEMSNELDVIPLFITGTTSWDKFKRCWMRLRTVSEKSRLTLKYFRSQGAIASEKYLHLQTHPHIIHPFSDIRKWWQCFMCITFLLLFITIPLDIAYHSLKKVKFFQSLPWKWLRLVLDCLCIIDLALNFMTGYYNPVTNQSVLEPGKIASHYAKTFFIPDLVSSIPTHLDLLFNINTKGLAFTILVFTSLLRILRYFTFVRYCRDFCEIFDVKHYKRVIINISVACIVYVHTLSCFLISSHTYRSNLISFKHNGSSSSLGNQTLDVPSTAKFSLMKGGSYPGALYTAMLLTTSSGYGKALPDADYEYLMAVIIWVVSRILMFFLISHIQQLVKATASGNNKYVEMVEQLKEYMSYKQFPDYMQRRLLNYYEFRFQRKYFRESEILNTISGELRQDVVMHSCRRLVENVNFFENLPLNLLVRIVSCLHSEIFLVNDVIVRANTPGNSMYLIASGTVAVYTTSGKEVCHLEDGAHFGEIALVMKDELRVASVVAVETTELYRLNRNDFVRAIHPYPDLLEHIQRIAADRMEKTTMLDEHNRREQASKRLY